MLRGLPILLAAGLLAGCGGGGDGGDDSRLTREEYAQQADAICAKYKQKTDALGRPSTLPALAKVADRVLPLLDDARGELRELQPPNDEQAKASAWLGQFDVIVADVEKIRDAAAKNDAAKVQSLAQPALRHNERANQLATDLGLKVCSKD